MSKRNTKRVDLGKLFKWSAPLEIKDESGEVVTTLYQRVVNDTDFEKARLAAVRKSHALRRALRDPSTDEHAALTETLESSGPEKVIDLILIQQIDTFKDAAVRESRTRMPKSAKGDVTLEQTEQYETDIDNFEAELQAEIAELLNARIEAEREKLLTLAKPELLEAARKAWENQLCTNTANVTLVDWLAYLSVYEDDTYTTKYFDSFQEFSELAEPVRSQIIAGYETLNIIHDSLKN